MPNIRKILHILQFHTFQRVNFVKIGLLNGVLLNDYYRTKERKSQPVPTVSCVIEDNVSHATLLRLQESWMTNYVLARVVLEPPYFLPLLVVHQGRRGSAMRTTLG